MRLNKYIAQYTKHSRRAADELISAKSVLVNDEAVDPGYLVQAGDIVSINGEVVDTSTHKTTTVMLNKPVGYVCSRKGQGSATIYELLPDEFRMLNTVGRLDKDSSGLILLTNDGELANSMTHPSFQKIKLYEIDLNLPLQPLHMQMISDRGINLEDGLSKFEIAKLDDSGKHLEVTLREGRNRQIRRTFDALGYTVTKLHRTQFGSYKLNGLKTGKVEQLHR